jgi:hypothetical protein
MGILRPVAVPSDVEDGVYQMHADLFPGKPVFEWAEELNLIPPPPSPPRQPGMRVTASAPIVETNSGAPRGIAPERIFEVRDAKGAALPITSFHLHAYEMADQVPAVDWFAECGNPAARKVWVVHFAIQNHDA